MLKQHLKAIRRLVFTLSILFGMISPFLIEFVLANDVNNPIELSEIEEGNCEV